MPTYDYECEACGHRFDVFQNMSDPALTTCPSCDQDSLKRLIGGGIGVIFKGSGFYVNDSKKSGSGTSSTSGNGAGKTSSGGSSDGGSGGGDSTSSSDSSSKSTNTSTSKSAAAT